jgi:hypothetical protein
MAFKKLPKAKPSQAKKITAKTIQLMLPHRTSHTNQQSSLAKPVSFVGSLAISGLPSPVFKPAYLNTSPSALRWRT